MSTEEEEQVFHVSDYIVETQAEPEIVTAGKAKKARKKKTPYSRTTDPEVEDLRKTAKAYCKCSEEWRLIRKKKAALEEWIEEHTFTRDKNIRDSCLMFGVKAYAFLLDKVTRGNGKVQEQICSDLSLHDSLSEIANTFLKHLTAATKAVILSGHDVMEGKRLQKLEAPPVVIEEENGAVNHTEQPRDNCDAAGATTGGGGEQVLPMQGQEGVHETEEEEEGCGEVPVCD